MAILEGKKAIIIGDRDGIPGQLFSFRIFGRNAGTDGGADQKSAENQKEQHLCQSFQRFGKLIFHGG